MKTKTILFLALLLAMTQGAWAGTPWNGESFFFDPLDSHYDSYSGNPYSAPFSIEAYAINTEIYGPGTVTVKNGDDIVNSATPGTQLTVILEAGEGYIVHGANIDNVDIDYNTFERQTPTYWVGTITMPESEINIKPEFVKPHAELSADSRDGKYTITTTCTEVTTHSGYALGVEIGTEVTLTVTPADGYAIENVLVQKYNEGIYYDVATTANNDESYTFVMPSEDVRVVVDYYKTGGAYDIISGSEDVTLLFYNEDNDPIKKANEGDVVKILVTAGNASDYGMMYNDYTAVFTVKDADNENISVYKVPGLDGGDNDAFTMPAKAVTVSTTFKLRIIVPSSMQIQNGTCTVTVGGESRDYADEGELVTCTVAPDEGYMLTKLMVYYLDMTTYETVDVECTKVNETTYTFYMPDRGVTVNPMLAPVPDQNSWMAYRAEAFASQDDNAKTISIATAEQLALLAYNVNYGGETYEGYTITIDATMIDLADHTWEPIGYEVSSGGMEGGIVIPGMGGGSASGFLGTFDGAARVIRNMNVKSDIGVGLFCSVQSDATVKNILLSSPLVKGEQYVGAIAGICYGTIENCHVIDGDLEMVEASESDEGTAIYPGNVESSPSGLGGIAGGVLGGSIAGCTVIRTTIYPLVEDAQYIGGIVGQV